MLIRTAIFHTTLKNACKIMTLYVAKILSMKEHGLLIFMSAANKKND